MNFNNACLPGCQPKQILTTNIAINDITRLQIFNNCCCEYSNDELKFGYSLDGICWSCYMSYNDLLTNTIDLNQDFFIRAEIPGVISSVNLNDTDNFTDYTTQLSSSLELSSCQNNPNLFNPYANTDGAQTLYTQLSESISCQIGIPIYYFKLSPNTNSKDITFKEYTLLDVESVKQIKLVIPDGQMPSSKATFTDFGFDFETDWETEITKQSFATAFGNNAQPMEGDLVYIPMMKRMWMVNEAYDEKKDGFMWHSTTFKVCLVKYQEKGSVNLGDSEDIVQAFVKNKYDDLFGNDEQLDSGYESVDAPKYAANNLYPVYESDATRKYITCDTTDFFKNNLYHKGVLISDNCYKFTGDAQIIYQKQYCGEEGTISFIIKPNISKFSGNIIEVNNIIISINQEVNKTYITLQNDRNIKIELESTQTYLIFIRWSKQLNICEMSAAKYSWPENLPQYRLTNSAYYFDFDNLIKCFGKWNIELLQDNKGDIILKNLDGTITNFKLFTQYIDNMADILEMYPTHQHLLINDTARQIFGMQGVQLH